MIVNKVFNCGINEKKKDKKTWTKIVEITLVVALYAGIIVIYNFTSKNEPKIDTGEVKNEKLDIIPSQEVKSYPSEPREEFEGVFTAYNAEVNQTDNDPTIMASGKEVYVGAIACPSKYDFGTKIKVNGKTYTCEDRMAKRFRDGEYFDIYMDSQEEALSFGRQKLEYEVIK